MKKFVQNIKKIAYLMKPYWKNARLLMLYWVFEAIVLEPAQAVANITIMQIVIDAIVKGKPYNDIIVIACVYFAFIMGINLLRRTVTILYAEKKNILVMQKIKQEVYNIAIETDYKYFDVPQFYDNYTITINEYGTYSANAVEWFFQLLSTAMTIVSITALLVLLGPWIVVINVAALILSTLIQLKLNRKYVDRYEKVLPWDRKINYIHRVFYMKEYAADVKTTNLREFLFKRYEVSNHEKIEAFRACSKGILGWTYLYNSIFSIKDIIVVSYIVWKIVTGSIVNIGAYTSLIAASGNLTASLQRFFSGFSAMDKMGLYADKIQQMLQFESPIEKNVQKDVNHKVPNGAFSVEMKNLCFFYQNSKFSLNNINLSISSGEKVALVGENGAGKSTLVKLLLRLYDTESGSILINGKSIKEYNVKELRKRVGVAFQTPNVYALPLLENIQLYTKTESREIDDILEKAKLSDLLKKTNGTIQTEVTKEFDVDGIVLSKGEMQKLSLARLMCGEFGLILLDEPSSALDPISEHEMTKLFFDQSNKTTTIMIAHRLSTIRNADKIYVLDNGSVLEAGNHEELMRLGGKYYEMFTKQAENYVNG